MKKYSNIIVQSILAIAIIVLFVLNCSSPKTSPSVSSNSIADLSDSPIAYVNIDSLVNGLDMWNDMQTELNEKQSQYDKELSNKQKNLQNKVNDLNNKIQKVLITRDDAQTVAQQIQVEEQEMYTLASDYQARLAEQNEVNTRLILVEVTEYLKEYNADNKFQYVLASSFGGQLLYADEKYDITAEIMTELNKKYNASKKKDTAK